MEVNEFEKMKGLLESKPLAFSFGYLSEDIVRGLVQNPLRPCTDKQAREIYDLFWRKYNPNPEVKE